MTRLSEEVEAAAKRIRERRRAIQDDPSEQEKIRLRRFRRELEMTILSLHGVKFPPRLQKKRDQAADGLKRLIDGMERSC